MNDLTLLEEVSMFRNMLVAGVEGKPLDHAMYARMRKLLMSRADLKSFVPAFLRTVRDASDYWGFIKGVSPQWEPRRAFIREQMEPLLSHLETAQGGVADTIATEVFHGLDSDHIRDVWDKALERRGSDPAGAITMARTLLESVSKHILDELKVSYDEAADLPRLYFLVLTTLEVAPNQQTEGIVKQIFRSSQAIVEGIGALRNKLGDSHGKGKDHLSPDAAYAELAVNLAGSVATFLVRIYKQRYP